MQRGKKGEKSRRDLFPYFFQEEVQEEKVNPSQTLSFWRISICMEKFVSRATSHVPQTFTTSKPRHQKLFHPKNRSHAGDSRFRLRDKLASHKLAKVSSPHPPVFARKPLKLSREHRYRRNFGQCVRSTTTPVDIRHRRWEIPRFNDGFNLEQLLRSQRESTFFGANFSKNFRDR